MSLLPVFTRKPFWLRASGCKDADISRLKAFSLQARCFSISSASLGDCRPSGVEIHLGTDLAKTANEGRGLKQAVCRPSLFPASWLHLDHEYLHGNGIFWELRTMGHQRLCLKARENSWWNGVYCHLCNGESSATMKHADLSFFGTCTAFQKSRLTLL